MVEAEVARLRGTVLAYGEALKEIEVYGRDPSAREHRRGGAAPRARAAAAPPRRCRASRRDRVYG